MYKQRIEKQIHQTIPDADRSTISKIEHVAEYVADIESNMKKAQHETMPKAFYMSN